MRDDREPRQAPEADDQPAEDATSPQTRDADKRSQAEGDNDDDG